jgi:hypothetical protein
LFFSSIRRTRRVESVLSLRDPEAEWQQSKMTLYKTYEIVSFRVMRIMTYDVVSFCLRKLVEKSTYGAIGNGEHILAIHDLIVVAWDNVLRLVILSVPLWRCIGLPAVACVENDDGITVVDRRIIAEVDKCLDDGGAASVTDIVNLIRRDLQSALEVAVHVIRIGNAAIKRPEFHTVVLVDPDDEREETWRRAII